MSVGEKCMSWMKNKLKNFTVMPAPMQVRRSANAKMKGTCAPRNGPHRRDCIPDSDAAAAASWVGLSVASATVLGVASGSAATAGGSWKNRHGRQLKGVRMHPAITTAFIWYGFHTSPTYKSPNAESNGPQALPTVETMAFVVNNPERCPAGMLSANSASDVLLASSAKIPSMTSAAYSSRTMSVTQAAMPNTAVATAKIVESFRRKARRVCKASTRMPTGIAKTRPARPEILSVMPTRLFRALCGANVGPTAAPPPR
mmetsp:Transcript_97632/g.273159  ORF Transcript_97632/g.273159 Transcript_97632/m.273159 type:complete len:258 (+) Transcript_97632:589-1362(+)